MSVAYIHCQSARAPGALLQVAPRPHGCGRKGLTALRRHSRAKGLAREACPWLIALCSAWRGFGESMAVSCCHEARHKQVKIGAQGATGGQLLELFQERYSHFD